MTLRLESADRYWEIVRDGKRLIIRNGTIGGGPPHVAVETFWFARRAIAAYEERVELQRAAGFGEVVAVPEPTARNAELEAAIRAHRDDPHAYDIYADWLQEHGNPFGELILLQRALDEHADPAKKVRMGELRRALGGDKPDIFTVEWRWGFWRVLRIDNAAADDELDPVAELAPVFARFACSQLETLRIGDLQYEDNARLIPMVIAEAGRHPWAAGLRHLHLGDVADIDLGMFSVGRVGEAVTRAFPNLEELRIWSGDLQADQPFGIGGLSLARLEKLTIETVAMSRVHLTALCAGNLPALTSLTLWFGSERYGADCTVADLEPILEGRAFPHLTTLGLCNFEHEHELARTIHSARIAPQLRHLDLSKGTIDDDSAIELASHRDTFTALESLDLSENHLSRRGIDVLERAFAGVALGIGEQKPADSRYISVEE